MDNYNLINYFINNMDTHSTIGELKRYKRLLQELQKREFTNSEKERFLNKIEEHTNVLKEDFTKLNNMLEATNNNEYQEILLYKEFPYKYKYDINKDIYLYNTISPTITNYPKGYDEFNISSNLSKNITKLINFILDKKSSSTISDMFMYYESSLTNFYVNPRFFGISNPYPDNYVLCRSFNTMINYNYYAPEIVGRYGELQVNNLLENNYNNIIWASKYVGDGFGYDIGIYDEINDSYKAIEVKTTMKEENLGKYRLSPREKLRMLVVYPNCNNYVYNIFLNEKGNIEKKKILTQKEYKKRLTNSN